LNLKKLISSYFNIKKIKGYEKLNKDDEPNETMEEVNIKCFIIRIFISFFIYIYIYIKSKKKKKIKYNIN